MNKMKKSILPIVLTGLLMSTCPTAKAFCSLYTFLATIGFGLGGICATTGYILKKESDKISESVDQSCLKCSDGGCGNCNGQSSLLDSAEEMEQNGKTMIHFGLGVMGVTGVAFAYPFAKKYVKNYFKKPEVSGI